MSLPSTRMRPLVGVTSRTIDRAMVDLPHPDSPTMAKVLPFSTEKLTASTARKTPSGTGYSTTRYSTARRGDSWRVMPRLRYVFNGRVLRAKATDEDNRHGVV